MPPTKQQKRWREIDDSEYPDISESDMKLTPRSLQEIAYVRRVQLYPPKGTVELESRHRQLTGYYAPLPTEDR